jgi:hypothetical protein
MPALSKEAWGAITAIAVALITGAVTLTTHYMSSEKKSEPSAASSSAAPAPVAAPAATSANADAIAGRWSGHATDAGNASFTIAVEVAQGCTLNARCGTISVSHVPCRGSIFLKNVHEGDYEFEVNNFVAPSKPDCQPGAGEHFQLAADGTLNYTTTYSSAHATLTRQN